ncbi:MAG: oxygen-independent coproporphyrinogen III oxidase [Pseudomonas fluorescens]|nr:MAG: oxygen-independent coproporphyrinogen III oxidase [Pseudomonas fluorescens]
MIRIEEPEIPFDLVEKYGGAVPRYTSYPTAPHFHAGVDGACVEEWLREIAVMARQPVASVYLHMAYCKALCLYCGCNMKVTHHAGVIGEYVRVVEDEIRRVGALSGRIKVESLHLGGGTPSYVPLQDLERLFVVLRECFEIGEGAEISMEMDPRQLPEGLPALMGKLGFTRASLGIQDTNPDVQAVIRRVQPQSMNVRAVKLLREAGVENINVDLLYGLPKQTVTTIRQTVKDVMELRPDRIALFGYAHVPWMKKHQAVLEQYGLPDANVRLAMFNAAVEALLDEGYVAVGIDHFCLPTDSMAKALKGGELKRNFMGYTTDDAPLLLGFGASAISQYPQGYAQNVTAPADYLRAMESAGLPIARGIRVNADDVARRGVIEQLLCGMGVVQPDLNDLLVQPHTLRGMVVDGIAEWRGDALRITEKGRPFARAVAACFDAYLPQGTGGRHSKGI